MAARKKIVFPYYNSYYTSTAIIIYQTNIIKTLNLLPDDVKPHLFIWHNHQSPLQEIKAINYPYITFINIKSFGFRLNKLASTICDKIGLSKLILFNTQYDSVYPAYQDSFLNGIKRRIYWKADFQENYYPQYFIQEEMNWVKGFFEHLKQDANSPLVLSSNDAWNDYKKFYPEVTNPVLLFRFVSHVPQNLQLNKLDSIKQKFSINKPYFIVCNQYWPHKNHIVILKTLHLLKQNGTLNFQFVFTGKTSSIRGNNYFKELQDYMVDNNLQTDVVITDFVEREEQLILMKKAIAIVQPTTFEGWSTVIEDGKALNQFVVASDIAVNVEQIEKNVSFFNPHNATQLAEIIQQLAANHPAIAPTNYQLNIQSSIEDLKLIFEL